jgi:hypothetical protein
MKEQSKPSRPAPEGIRSSRLPSDRNYTPSPSDRRSQPLLVRQWKYLWREEFVELRRGLKVMDTGWVDQVTADGTTIWIHLSSGMRRVMIHQDDGIDTWRVDSRICGNRSDH